jgi:hypothetical protein
MTHRLLLLFAVLFCSSTADAQSLFPIEVNHLWGYIDSTGTVVIQPKYAIACPFNEGAAWVVLKSRNTLSFDETAMNVYESMRFEFQRDGTDYTWNIIDAKGNVLGSTERTKLKPLVQNGLTPIFDGDYFRGGWGLIDKKGTIVQKGVYTSIGFVNDGRAKIGTGEFGPYGFIDLSGKLVSTVEYQQAESFSEGLAAALDPESQKWGYLDTECKWAIKPQFASAGSIHEGLAYFSTDSLFGYIDNKGKVVIKAKYKDADSFSDGRARVQIKGKFGYIDSTGALVIPATLEVPKPADAFTMNTHIHTFREGLAIVERDGKIGYIDKMGKEIIAPQFDDASTFEHGLARVKKGDKWCYINRTGKVIWQHL